MVVWRFWYGDNVVITQLEPKKPGKVFDPVTATITLPDVVSLNGKT